MQTWLSLNLMVSLWQNSVVKLFELSEASQMDPSVLPEARRLQSIIAQADATIIKASIAGTKALLQALYGYGGHPRRPLGPIDASAAQALLEHRHTQDLVRLERGLTTETS